LVLLTYGALGLAAPLVFVFPCIAYPRRLSTRFEPEHVARLRAAVKVRTDVFRVAAAQLIA
jgi:hypothetical protein